MYSVLVSQNTMYCSLSYVIGQNKSLNCKQSKDNNSSVTWDILTILHVHNNTIVILGISFIKFHPLLTKLWLRAAKTLEFRQVKGNHSSITDDILMKLHLQTRLWLYIFSISFMKFRLYGRGQNKSLKFKYSKANNSSVT